MHTFIVQYNSLNTKINPITLKMQFAHHREHLKVLKNMYRKNLQLFLTVYFTLLCNTQ